MQKHSIYANPFALMMDPEAVVAAMESSERLNGLSSRVCRPLDKPLIPLAKSDTASFDEAIDGIEIELEMEELEVESH
jgi:hypothetical protein